jgi:hypothetical protein
MKGVLSRENFFDLCNNLKNLRIMSQKDAFKMKREEMQKRNREIFPGISLSVTDLYKGVC